MNTEQDSSMPNGYNNHRIQFAWYSPQFISLIPTQLLIAPFLLSKYPGLDNTYIIWPPYNHMLSLKVSLVNVLMELVSVFINQLQVGELNPEAKMLFHLLQVTLCDCLLEYLKGQGALKHRFP